MDTNEQKSDEPRKKIVSFYYVALFCVCICSLVDLVRLSVPAQVTDWKDSSVK